MLPSWRTGTHPDRRRAAGRRLLASLVAGRLRVPGLLLFLFLGMAIGSDGLG
jgi:hypothetical protein